MSPVNIYFNYNATSEYYLSYNATNEKNIEL